MVKKNGQRTVGRGRSTRRINTPQYEAWLTEALAVVQQNRHQVKEPIKVHIHAKFIYFFKDRQAEPDLSNLHEGIQDVLKSCGIIWDDVLIESHDGSRKRFYQEPRLEVELFEYLGPIDEKPPKTSKKTMKPSG